MKKESIFLISLIFILILINYSFIDSQLIKSFEEPYEVRIATRIIDGDTIKIGNESIRLLGMNSPERGEKYYEEAKNFLNKKILGKEVKIYFGKNKYDRYKRKLGYIFFKGKNLNLESVKEGYSNIYFPDGKTKYYEEFETAWRFCLNSNKNLCEQSSNKCMVLKKWEVDSQIVLLQNICSNDINLKDWSIKDEGRKKYVFSEINLKPNQEIILTAKDWNKTYVWTKTGDSIFIRDDLGKLVFWDNY